MCPTKKPSKLVREFSASSESRFARSFVRTLVEGTEGCLLEERPF